MSLLIIQNGRREIRVLDPYPRDAYKCQICKNLDIGLSDDRLCSDCQFMFGTYKAYTESIKRITNESTTKRNTK